MARKPKRTALSIFSWNSSNSHSLPYQPQLLRSYRNKKSRSHERDFFYHKQFFVL